MKCDTNRGEHKGYLIMRTGANLNPDAEKQHITHVFDPILISDAPILGHAITALTSVVVIKIILCAEDTIRE